MLIDMSVQEKKNKHTHTHGNCDYEAKRPMAVTAKASTEIG